MGDGPREVVLSSYAMMGNGGLQPSREGEVLKGQRYEEVRGKDEFVMAVRREKGRSHDG